MTILGTLLSFRWFNPFSGIKYYMSHHNLVVTKHNPSKCLLNFEFPRAWPSVLSNNITQQIIQMKSPKSLGNQIIVV